MYAYLYGEIVEILSDNLVIDVGGIGYNVFCDMFTLSSIKVGQLTKIYTHLNVKEDSMTLYGFYEAKYKEMFETLIAISGVGPKVALKTLSVLRPDEIALAVLSDNVNAFKGVSGLGVKIASRIILELKQKMGKISSSELAGAFVASPGGVEGSANVFFKDSVDALMGLGYNYTTASELVKAVYKDGMSIEDVIGSALKMGR